MLDAEGGGGTPASGCHFYKFAFHFHSLKLSIREILSFGRILSFDRRFSLLGRFSLWEILSFDRRFSLLGIERRIGLLNCSEVQTPEGLEGLDTIA